MICTPSSSPGDADFLAGAVEAVHAPETEGEMVPVALRQVLQPLGVGIEAARGNLVQQRFPQVGGRSVDQRDVRALPFAELVAQPGGQFQSTRATTDDDDFMHALLRCHGLPPYSLIAQ